MAANTKKENAPWVDGRQGANQNGLPVRSALTMEYRNRKIVLRKADLTAVTFYKSASWIVAPATPFMLSHRNKLFQLCKHDSSCGQARDLQDNELAYHNRPVSHTAPRISKSISYLSNTRENPCNMQGNLEPVDYVVEIRDSRLK